MRYDPCKFVIMPVAIIGLVLTQLVSADRNTADNPAADGITQGSGFSIPWHTINAGGTVSASGGSWTLAGTIGQFDATAAGALSGRNWAVTGGFWAAGFESAPTIDQLFSDRFELLLPRQ